MPGGAMNEHETLGVRPDSTAMVRALGALYLVGPSVAALTLVLPRSPHTDATPIWIAIAAVYAMAPLIFFYYRRLPDWAISATIAVTNAAITTGIFFNHEAVSFYAFFYLWVTPYAAAFFSGRHALGHVTLVGALYTVTLATTKHPAPGGAQLSQWLQTMCALLVTMLLVRSLSRALRENLAQIDEERRRRAVEINDDVVQRLVIARQAYGAGDEPEGDDAVEAALGRARAIMAELIDSDRVVPGSLRRDKAAA